MSPKETSEFLETFFSQVSPDDLSSFVLFPPAPSWFVFSGQKKVQWGGQNVYFETSGAFTGENSAATLKEMGGGYALVGHSERRHVFHEPEEWMAKKVLSLQKQGLTPVLCVGETLEERQAHQTEKVIGRQLETVLSQLEKDSPLWVAYEPVWAIGTGQVASPEQASEAQTFLRSLIGKAWGDESARKIPLLYGGSVKPENAGELSRQPNIDGFLVGGASLKPESFIGIFNASR